MESVGIEDGGKGVEDGPCFVARVKARRTSKVLYQVLYNKIYT